MATTDLSRWRIFRLTHISNLPHILKYGITHFDSVNKNSEYVPIGDVSLISNRGCIRIGGRQLNEYIPFYFGPRTPMLYVIQNGFNDVVRVEPENIVYCVSTVSRILDCGLDFMFTDGHAKSGLTSCFGKDEIHNLDSIVKREDVYREYWNIGEDLDIKRRKEAEFLVYGDVPFKAIAGFVVYNEDAKRRLQELGVVDSQIHVKMDFCF